MDRHRIDYIRKTPFHLLSRKEITVRKLLAKFVDPLFESIGDFDSAS